MNTIRLKPKFEKIRKDLVRNNKDNLHRDSVANAFIEVNALMIAQGIQLYEESAGNNQSE